MRPTAPVAPTTATVRDSGRVSGMVRPSADWLSGTGGVYQRVPAGPGGTVDLSDGLRAGRRASASSSSLSPAATSRAISANAFAAGDRYRSRCQMRAMRRAGRSVGMIRTAGSVVSTARSGTRAVPRPAPTIAWTVPLSSDRNTKFGSAPRERMWSSTQRVLLHERKPISRCSPMSCMDGMPARPASGEPAAVTSTNGSWRSSTASNGPSWRGSTPNERSSAPGPRSSNRPWSLLASVRRISTFGHASPKRPMIAGSTRVPTLWYTPTRSVPVSPAAYARRSARAAWRRSVIASTWRWSSRPASVSSTVRRPRPRSNSRTPSAVSSPMTCWLTADCV